MGALLNITPEEFDLWTNLVYEYTGIAIPANKMYLVENRLSDLVAEMGCRTFKELYFKCRYSQDHSLKETIINRISTQETSFFRDPHVFQVLRDVIIEEVGPAQESRVQGASAKAAGVERGLFHGPGSLFPGHAPS